MSLNVGNLWASLSLNISQFMASLTQAQTAVRNTGAQMQNALGQAPSNAINNTRGQLNQLSNQLNRTGKDFERVVGGIITAQAFYKLTNAIEDTSRAIVRFSNNMQMAQISMEYFLGSTDRAKGFLEVMKDFAALTPFSTDQSINMSRRLMAMGFQAESVKSVMSTLVDAASATGGTAEQMERIVLALGQMKTNGYIAGQELRQLAEAGIPIYKILQEQLGLTTEQLKEIGKMKISGDLGVATTLKGLEERYKGAATRIAETVPGMWSTIKDDFLIISEQMIKGAYDIFGGMIKSFRDIFEKMRSNLRSGGLGGMFEAMFPVETQRSIRNIIASLKIIGDSVINLAKAFGPVISILNNNFTRVLGQVLPIIASVIRVITNLTTVMMNTVPGVKYFIAAIISIMVVQIVGKALLFFWNIVKIGSICTFVAQAVTILSRSLQALYIVCTKNPIIAIVMLIAGALLYLAMSSKTVTAWLDQLTAKLATLAGVDPGGILNPENNKEIDLWTKQFNASLDVMSDNLKDVGKDADKAGKKVKDKFVATFDEVFQVPDKLDDVSDSLKDIGGSQDFKLPNFTMPNLKDMLPNTKDLEMPGIDWRNWLLMENKNPKNGNNNNGNGGSNIPPFDPSPVEAFVATIETLIARARKAIGNLWPNPMPVPVFDIQPFVSVGRLMEQIKAASESVRRSFTNWVFEPVIEPALVAIQNSLTALQDTGETVYVFFTETLPKAISDFFTELVPQMVTSLSDAFYQVGTNIGPIVNGFLQGVGKALIDGFQAIGKWIAENWQKVLLAALIAAVAVVLFIFGGEIIAALAAVGAAIWAGLTALGGTIAGFFSGGLLASTAGSISVGFAAIAGAVAVALVGVSAVFIKWGNEIKLFFVNLWNGIKTGASNIWTGISSNFTTNIGNLVNDVKTKFNLIRDAVSGAWTTIQQNSDKIWPNIKKSLSTVCNGIENIFKDFKTNVLGIWDNIWKGIKGIINSIIGGINKLINGMNSLSFNIPSWVPGDMGGKSLGFKIPKIPQLAEGGIVNKDQLVRIGEGNKREAVVPLENSSAMRPFSEAVAKELATLLTGAPKNPPGGALPEEGKTPVYFLYADEQALKTLQRRLNVIQLNEGARRV